MEGKRAKLLLIVDDDRRNLSLLDAILIPHGFKTIKAESGEEALELFRQFRPDLILLDIMMPGMDGFEVCKRIRQMQGELHVPIIMVTALEETSDKERAAQAGADDFISKPINRTELIIRINSLIRISSFQKRLYRKNKELLKMNEKLNRIQKAKEELIHMIIHDLKNPLTGIYGNLELLKLRKDGLDDKQSILIAKAIVACDRMMNMIQNILDVYKLSEGKLTPQIMTVDVRSIISETLELFRISASLKGVQMKTSFFCDNRGFINTDPELFKRILGNLLSNAIRYSPESETVDIYVSFINNHLMISVRDRGPGIPDELKDKIFIPFEQFQLAGHKDSVGSAGLGLTFSKMATETLGGKIWVEDPEKGPGSVFKLRLPA